MATLNSLVLGTRNAKKRRELQELLAPCHVQVLSLDDFPEAVEVAETGASFAENAALKATEQARALGQWVLGEDSGLAVDALQGAPGIYSARYAGEQATDQENNERLLEALKDTPPLRRGAAYVCHLSLSDPGGQVRIDCEATCRGMIAQQPAGSHGFGYDPLFLIPEYHRSFGQLGPMVKQALSHRSRAMRQFVPRLLRLREEVER